MSPFLMAAVAAATCASLEDLKAAQKEGVSIYAMRFGNSRQGCESNGVKVPYRQLPDSDG